MLPFSGLLLPSGGNVGVPYLAAVSSSPIGAMSSSNATSWVSRTIPSITWQKVCVAPWGMFVAVGGSSTNGVATSVDGGLTWTQRTAPSGSWVNVLWADNLGLFVAIANTAAGNNVMTSPDGINWTLRAGINLANLAPQGLSWSSSLNLLVLTTVSGASGSFIYTSPDAVTWTNRTNPLTSKSWNRSIWVPAWNLFVAGAPNTGTNNIMTSPDGTNWTARAGVSGYSVNALVYATALGKGFTIGQNAGTAYVMSSTDGATWAAVTTFTATPKGMVWSPSLGLLIAVCDNGVSQANQVQTSPDGAAWTARSAANDAFWTDLAVAA